MNLLAARPLKGFSPEFWQIYDELSDLPKFRTYSFGDRLKASVQVANLIGASVYSDELLAIGKQLTQSWRVFYLGVSFVDLITTKDEVESALAEALKQTDFKTEDRSLCLALVNGLLLTLERRVIPESWWIGRLKDAIAIERAIQLNRVVYSDRYLAVVYISSSFAQVSEGELAIVVKSETELWTCDHISTNKRVPAGSLRRAKVACENWRGATLEGKFRDRAIGKRLARFLGLEVRGDRAILRPTKQNFT